MAINENMMRARERLNHRPSVEECSLSITDIKHLKKYRSRVYDEQFSNAKTVRETGDQSVNGRPKIAQKCARNVPTISWPPYSPDLAPLDFFLFLNKKLTKTYER